MTGKANIIPTRSMGRDTRTGLRDQPFITSKKLVDFLEKLGGLLSRVLYHKSLLFGLVFLSMFIIENFLQFLCYVVLILGGAAGVAFVELIERFFGRRPKSFFKALKRDRKEDNYNTFKKSMERSKIESLILETVYRHVGHEARVPIRPADHVFKDLRLPRFAYTCDLLPSIVWKCGKTMQKARRNPYFADRHRIDGMVKFIHHQPARKRRKSFFTLLKKMYLWDDERREEEIRYLNRRRRNQHQRQPSATKDR